MSVDNGRQEKTIGQLLDEMRAKSGAKQYMGHDIMDLMRFDENTRHMIVFDVKKVCPFGSPNERRRLFLTEEGYQKAQELAKKGDIKILNRARVVNGDLHYARKDRIL